MTHSKTGFEPAQYRLTPVKKIEFFDTHLCQFCIRTDTHLIGERKNSSFHFLSDLFTFKNVVEFPTNNMAYHIDVVCSLNPYLFTTKTITL
jgi:hypothetical protein